MMRRIRTAWSALLVSAAVAVSVWTVSSHAQTPVALFGFEVLDKRPHPRENFVQGLEIHGDALYVGTGGYGESRLREYEFTSMQLRRDYALPEVFFGEGITRLGDRIYQLTWRAGVGLIYDLDNFAPLGHWPLKTQGWGLTNNGTELIYGDGSDRLFFAAPDALENPRVVAVTLNGQPLGRLNELEWIDGSIWANVWGANQLVRINPSSGEVNAIADLRGLLPEQEYQADTNVLNGIAFDRANDAFWVTGKRWPWLYRIALKPLPAPANPTADESASQPPAAGQSR